MAGQTDHSLMIERDSAFNRDACSKSSSERRKVRSDFRTSQAPAMVPSAPSTAKEAPSQIKRESRGQLLAHEMNRAECDSERTWFDGALLGEGETWPVERRAVWAT